MNFSNLSSANSSGSAGNRFLVSVRFNEILPWSIVLGSMTSLGVIINVLVLVAAWPEARRKSSFGLLVSHFVGLNLLMCLFNFPSIIYLVNAKTRGWWLPEGVCGYLRNVSSVIAFTLNWSDVALAVNRLTALFFPHNYAKLSSVRIVIGMMIFPWIVGLLGAAIPPAIVGLNISRISPIGICLWDGRAAGAAGEATVFYSVFIPYAISGVGAILIFAKSCQLTYRSKVRVSISGPNAPSVALRQRLNKSRMLLVTFVWTALCAAPDFVAVYYFMAAMSRDPTAALWMRIPPALLFCFTPFVMLLSNNAYRIRIAKIIAETTGTGSHSSADTGTSH